VVEFEYFAAQIFETKVINAVAFNQVNMVYHIVAVR